MVVVFYFHHIFVQVGLSIAHSVIIIVALDSLRAEEVVSVLIFVWHIIGLDSVFFILFHTRQTFHLNELYSRFSRREPFCSFCTASFQLCNLARVYIE